MNPHPENLRSSGLNVILIALIALLTMPAYSQFTTNAPANVTGSYSFNTNYSRTNVTTSYSFNTNYSRTNVTGSYSFNTNYSRTNVTGSYSFNTNYSRTNVTSSYAFNTNYSRTNVTSAYSFNTNYSRTNVGNGSGFDTTAPSFSRRTITTNLIGLWITNSDAAANGFYTPTNAAAFGVLSINNFYKTNSWKIGQVGSGFFTWCVTTNVNLSTTFNTALYDVQNPPMASEPYPIGRTFRIWNDKGYTNPPTVSPVFTYTTNYNF